MQDLSAVLTTLQYCQDSLSPLSHPAHKRRLQTVVMWLQNQAAAKPEPLPDESSMRDYLYTLSMCRTIVRNDGEKQAHILAVEEFVRARFD